jgi:hypothetical protein
MCSEVRYGRWNCVGSTQVCRRTLVLFGVVDICGATEVQPMKLYTIYRETSGSICKSQITFSIVLPKPSPVMLLLPALRSDVTIAEQNPYRLANYFESAAAGEGGSVLRRPKVTSLGRGTRSCARAYHLPEHRLCSDHVAFISRVAWTMRVMKGQQQAALPNPEKASPTSRFIALVCSRFLGRYATQPS